MKLTTQLKISFPDPSLRQSLLHTLETANAACNYISQVAFDNQAFDRIKLHNLVYKNVRDKFNLPAQLTARCIGKVKDAYKSTRAQLRSENHRRRTLNRRLTKQNKKLIGLAELRVIKFSKWGSMPYDDRNLTFKPDNSISIGTLDGRIRCDLIGGDYNLNLLQYRKGESDLSFRDGQFYLNVTCEIQDGELFLAEDYLGIDRGIRNIAVDSDGVKYGHGRYLRRRRYQYCQVRAQLQSKKTKSAKRRLRMRRRKERRFATDVNHVISKQIVQKAERTKTAIVLEDLTGIRTSERVYGRYGYTKHTWAFRQLEDFIRYKAKLTGVTVISVNAANTSRTCPNCECCDKANRNRSWFRCVKCGFRGEADNVAATTIRCLGAVNHPNAGVFELSRKPRPLGRGS